MQEKEEPVGVGEEKLVGVGDDDSAVVLEKKRHGCRWRRRVVDEVKLVGIDVPVGVTSI